MKHDTTNLLKGSLMRWAVYGVILTTLTISCGTSAKTAKPFPLLGKWTITGLTTTESRQLDPVSQEIYQQEVNKMLAGAFMEFTPDSTYHLNMGNEQEAGRWKWDPTDSLLRLQDQNRKKTYYVLQPLGQQSFILKKQLDPQGLQLVIENLPH